MLPERYVRVGRNGAAVERDPWRFVAAGEAVPQGRVAVPLATWIAERDRLLARRAPLGVWLEPDEDPARIAADLPRLALVAIRFPKFTDGRGYSTATLLRGRHGFAGELRAFGDVGRDQLYFLRRCGFDAFSLAPHRDPEAALAGLHAFSVRYQGAVDDPRPLFRRREAAARA